MYLKIFWFYNYTALRAGLTRLTKPARLNFRAVHMS